MRKGWKVTEYKKILLKYNPVGKRDPGRPQKRWKEQFVIQ
jgi:hypothetical protein